MVLMTGLAVRPESGYCSSIKKTVIEMVIVLRSGLKTDLSRFQEKFYHLILDL